MVNVLKRLESSVHSFRKTLEAILAKNTSVLAMLEAGTSGTVGTSGTEIEDLDDEEEIASLCVGKHAIDIADLNVESYKRDLKADIAAAGTRTERTKGTKRTEGTADAARAEGDASTQPKGERGVPTFDNVLVHGDNLEALKALLPFYAGRVKCIYIDPPYNTGSAFAHYDDNLEHSQWLNMMYPRLKMLKEFLSEDGSIWISIDDDEQAYLKVICDEIFGRQNFVTTVIWQKRTSPDMRATISDGHDFILVYATDKDKFKMSRNQLPLTEEQAACYKNPDKDPRGPWTSTDFTAQGWRPNQMYEIIAPAGNVIKPQQGRCWRHLEDVYKQLRDDNRLWFGGEGPRR